MGEKKPACFKCGSSKAVERVTINREPKWWCRTCTRTL